MIALSLSLSLSMWDLLTYDCNLCHHFVIHKAHMAYLWLFTTQVKNVWLFWKVHGIPRLSIHAWNIISTFTMLSKVQRIFSKPCMLGELQFKRPTLQLNYDIDSQWLYLEYTIHIVGPKQILKTQNNITAQEYIIELTETISKRLSLFCMWSAITMILDTFNVGSGKFSVTLIIKINMWVSSGT